MAKMEDGGGGTAATISVELVFATAQAAERQTLGLPARSTVAEAIAASRFAGQPAAAVAIHGELAAPDRPLQDGDRIELLRELLVDPVQARRSRASMGGRGS